MPLYYYIFSVIVLSLLILFIRCFLMRKMNIPVELFETALRNENAGEYEAAVAAYESALHEFKKNKLQGKLKNKVIEKIKVLHTIIEYENGLRFIR